MPEARIELARTQGPEDFESSASTYFTTPALDGFIFKIICAVNKFARFPPELAKLHLGILQFNEII